MPQKFQNLKNSHRFSKSSQQWLKRQINDPFVEKAKEQGFRSRAVFKLIEIDEKFKIFKKNHIVVDLGAAPGGWSQYAITKCRKVIAIDLLDMPPIAGVDFLQCDFLAENSQTQITLMLNHHNKQNYCNVVLSDMAANASGNKTIDHLQIINLLESSLLLASKILKQGGSFIGKIFQGGSSETIIMQLKQHFSIVKYFKPKSSRPDSAETYLVALGFKGNSN